MNKALLLISLLLLSPLLEAKHAIVFGVVPQQSASRSAALWGPVVNELESRTGLTIKFATARSIPEFEERLARGEYDIAYMNPYHYTVFSSAPGYRAFVKERDKEIKGILVVRKDSELTQLSQLEGKELAFPSPAAFAATLLPRSYLSQHAIDHTPAYVSNHDSVYRAVAKGLYPAGGGIIRTFSNVDPAISEQLRVLWISDGYTPHAIAYHPDVNADMKRKIQQALIALEQDDRGQELLKALKIRGFEAAEDSDWDDVRMLAGP